MSTVTISGVELLDGADGEQIRMLANGDELVWHLEHQSDRYLDTLMVSGSSESSRHDRTALRGPCASEWSEHAIDRLHDPARQAVRAGAVQEQVDDLVRRQRGNAGRRGPQPVEHHPDESRRENVHRKP